MMPYIYFFHCLSCGYEFTLTEGGDCWIDEEGNFGIAIHVSGEITGNPAGKPQYNIYDNQICLKCKKIYTVVYNNERMCFLLLRSILLFNEIN